MIDLTTHYMGLTLRNPPIVARSGLTGSVTEVTRCARAGAKAVVFRPLFKQQIDAHTSDLSQRAHKYSS